MASQLEHRKPNALETAREREDLLYAMLCDLAREDRPLPRIPDFAPALDLVGHGSVYNVLDRLEAQGRIVVDGFSSRKAIHIPALALTVSSGANPRGGRRRPVADILALVARVACLPVDVITGPRRSRLELRPRYVAIRLARLEGWSFDDIGRALGRDHSSVINGWEVSEGMLPRDKLFARLLRRAEAELAGLPEPGFALRQRAAPLLVAPTARRPIEVDEDDCHQVADLRKRRLGSSQLLAALRREHPERCAA